MNGTITAQQICEQIQDLPEESLGDLARYIELLRSKSRATKVERARPPFRVVTKLEGLLEDYTITDEDIAEARQEMWGRFGEFES